MHLLREGVESQAARLGLQAIYGTAFCNHTRSQAAYDRLGNVPTGIYTGMGKMLEFRHMPVTAQAGGEVSLLHYFKMLKELPVRELFCPQPYITLIESLLFELGLGTRLRPLGEDRAGAFRPSPTGRGKPRMTWQAGPLGGQELPTDGGPVWLDFPMLESGWLGDFHRARARGYRFAALLPLALDGRFHLRLQKVPTDQDWSALQLHHPLARQIRDFMCQEKT